MSPFERLAIHELEQRVAELESQIKAQDSRDDCVELRRQLAECKEQILLIAKGSVTVTQGRDMTEIKAGGDVASDGSMIVKSMKKITGGTPAKIVWALIAALALAAGWINSDQLVQVLGLGESVEQVDE